MNQKYTVDYIMSNPNFLKEFTSELNEFDQSGKEMVSQCEKFDTMQKHRENLEKYNFEHGKLTELRQKAWDELAITYPIEREKRTQLIQKFIDMCKERQCEIPEWLKEHKWLHC